MESREDIPQLGIFTLNTYQQTTFPLYLIAEKHVTASTKPPGKAAMAKQLVQQPPTT